MQGAGRSGWQRRGAAMQFYQTMSRITAADSTSAPIQVEVSNRNTTEATATTFECNQVNQDNSRVPEILIDTSEELDGSDGEDYGLIDAQITADSNRIQFSSELSKLETAASPLQTSRRRPVLEAESPPTQNATRSTSRLLPVPTFSATNSKKRQVKGAVGVFKSSNLDTC